jgi:hypothetical protein
MYENIERHGNQLNVIFNTGLDAITLCKKLHSLEIKANRIATDWCNGLLEDDDIDRLVNPILSKVKSILKTDAPIKFNGDARGYALKLDDKYVRDNSLAIYTDWGGYGIIAPDFTPNN